MGIMGKVRGKEKKERETDVYIVLQDIIEGHNAKIFPGGYSFLEDPPERANCYRDKDITVWEERKEIEEGVPPVWRKGSRPESRPTVILENVKPGEVVELEERILDRLNDFFDKKKNPDAAYDMRVVTREATYDGSTLKLVFDIYNMYTPEGESPPKFDEPVRECAPGTVNPWEQAEQSR